MFMRRYPGDYDHLARVKEWSLSGGADEDEAARRMNQRTIPPAVIANQHAASDPAVSAWVSANAGAGKTHVLAQRVIRLLLERHRSGENPLPHLHQGGGGQHGEPHLRRRCANGSRSTTPSSTPRSATPAPSRGGNRQRDRARRLFASALETPGGLKVQTIHGFCTRLLQQFPFEANVPARFRVLEEVEQQQLLEQLRRTVLFEASSNPDSAAGRALAAIIPAASDFAFQEGLHEAIRERERLAGLARARRRHRTGRGAAFRSARHQARRHAGSGRSRNSSMARICRPSDWMSAAGICALRIEPRPGSGRAPAERDRRDGRTRVEAYLEIFFTDNGELRRRSSPQRSQPISRSRATNWLTRKTRLPSLCERRRAVIDPRPHRWRCSRWRSR